MRLVMAVETPALVGGVQTYLQMLIPKLRERGHEVAMVYLRRPASSVPSLLDMDVEAQWCLEELGMSGLTERLGAWSADVIFDHGIGELELQRLWVERWPTVVLAHDYVGLCISGTKRFRWPRRGPCGRTLGPACLVHYLPRGCGGRSMRTAVSQYVLQRRRLQYLEQAAAVWVFSEHMRHSYLSQGLQSGQVRVLPPLRVGDAPLVSVPPSVGRPHRLLFLGRLTELKGADLLVRAAAEVGKRLHCMLRVEIAGDGPERARLEKLARTLDVSAQFHGWVDGSRRSALLRDTDVLVFPSVWPEPFGLVGLEAAAWAVPTVAFDVGGVRQWLVPGKSGELCRGRPSVEALVEALVRVLGNPDYLEVLKQGALQRAKLATEAQHLHAVIDLLNEVKAEWRLVGK